MATHLFVQVGQHLHLELVLTVVEHHGVVVPAQAVRCGVVWCGAVWCGVVWAEFPLVPACVHACTGARTRTFDPMPKWPSIFLMQMHATDGGAMIIKSAGDTVVACMLKVCMIDTTCSGEGKRGGCVRHG